MAASGQLWHEDFRLNDEPDEDLPDDVNVSFSAPAENLWFHGRLDRLRAEQRLRAAGADCAGCYLVRESDRRPGSYVLSFLGTSGVNHFRITALCGDYYIGGRQFESLADLVGYYTSWSDLLKRERLVHPVPPPEPVSHKRRVAAILPYAKMPETDELSFQKGDIFIVHNDMGDGWLWVTQHRTGLSGLIFQELVEDLDETIDPNEIYPWFHSRLSKCEAVERLVSSGPGSFLVRPSDNSPGDYSLFFHVRNTIQRFRIERKGNRYLMGGRYFDSLDAVVGRYRSEQIVEGYTLGPPVVKVWLSTPLAPKVSVSGPNASESSKFAVEFKTPPLEATDRKSEDIYATLRECRESNRKSRGIRMQGHVHRKSQHTKKWKQTFAVLQTLGTERHLLFYDGPKRAKPKALVDLAYSALYVVHDSFFERPNCFQLVEKALPCLSTVHYLCAPSRPLQQEWMQAIRSCVRHGGAGVATSGAKELRSLRVWIVRARRIPTKLVPHPYCIVALGDVQVCRTRVRDAPDPVWDEEFFLDDIPLEVASFTVTVYNRGKQRCKDTEIAAEVVVELQSGGGAAVDADDVEREDWFRLCALAPPMREDWGSIRVRARYRHEIVMPLAEYAALRELALDLDAVAPLADAAAVRRDRHQLARVLLRVWRHERRELYALHALNDAAVAAAEEDAATLFRSDSLATTLMDLYMASSGAGFVQAALRDVVGRVVDSAHRQSCELNPGKLAHPADAMVNAHFLLALLDDVIESIFMAAEACPRPLRFICGQLQRAVVARWPHEPLVRTRVVSGFVFLRLLCPAVLNPRLFDLVPEPPGEGAARNLVMVAKCLQNLANLVEFGGKEPYMDVVNPFIIKNKERMVLFLDHLSNVRERPAEQQQHEESFQDGDVADPARDLATLHHLCATHLADLQVLARTRPAVKRLVTVVEMLSKHKQRHVEMLQ